MDLVELLDTKMAMANSSDIVVLEKKEMKSVMIDVAISGKSNVRE